MMVPRFGCGSGSRAVEDLRQLAEEPGRPEAAAADDHAVAARLPHHAERVPALPDVAVAEDRDADDALQRRDGVPVGVARVELRRGAGVQPDRAAPSASATRPASR